MQKELLIIEPDEAFGRSLVQMLEGQGHRAVLVADEQAAQRSLTGRSPCLILIGSLDADSLRALVRFLRSHHRTIPTVIMATPPAAGGAATEERSDDDPIPMVARPGDPEALLQVVNRFCLHTAAETVIN